MPKVITISTEKPDRVALDYEELRKIGIGELEKAASSIWTDYNIHDPGITTLEFLCYALTDLGYRSLYSIPDLLATPSDTAKNIQQHFITAKDILPNRAVTINDYRKLLIDLDNIKNAWISPDTKTIFADLINKKLSFYPPNSRKWRKITLRGFYKVLLEFEINVKEEEKDEISRQARKALNDNRNLCEDFTTIEPVGTEKFRLCSEMEIAPEADPIELLAQVFFNIQLHLSPFVKFHSLAELQKQGYTSDSIFEGPLLSHGYIKDEELTASELKTTIRLSDIIQQVLAVEGVLNIDEIQLNSLSKDGGIGNRKESWLINVTTGKKPEIDIAASRVVLYKNDMPFRPDPQVIKQRFMQLMDDYLSDNQNLTSQDIGFDTGTYRDVNRYYSIQEHFPKTYGISHWGLPDDASPERKIQAKQLKSYLYFFDQQLSNYLAQLSNINQLFSIRTDVKHTYFTQLADGFKDASELFLGTTEEMRAKVQEEAETAETFDQRRNRFLDHLLSRFSESFFEYVNILHSLFPEVNRQELIDIKLRFLQNYPEYSSRRFSAYDYMNELQWDSENISGLEKRLQSLLGIRDIKRRTLVNVYFLIQGKGQNDPEEFHFEIVDNHSGKPLLVGSEKYNSEAEAKNAKGKALKLASDPGRFSIREGGGESNYRIELNDETGNLLALSPGFTARAEALARMSQLHNLITENRTEEGMFLIENLLLIPNGSSLSSPLESPDLMGFMPICGQADGEEEDNNDPYSFRLHFVLPAYAERFMNMDFRRYCERIIRMETPAHLYPKICWVNNEQLQEFEKTYQSWLEIKSEQVSDQNNAVLQRLIEVLSTLKTVYPPARLQDCTSMEERQLFLLNQNALGTLK